jgi:hypothetical protein
MLRCDGPLFRAGPVRYSNTCVHTKFEADRSVHVGSVQ